MDLWLTEIGTDRSLIQPELDRKDSNYGYECHVTTNRIYKDKILSVAEKHKFKTSAIEGDPELGSDTHFYCTSHSSSYINLYNRMEALIQDLKDLYIPILRKKIELIVLDERF